MQFYGRSAINGQGIREIAEGLKGIKEDLSHVISGFNRLNINIYDSSDRNKESKVKQKTIAAQVRPRSKKKAL
jgi:hypothetical protein